MSVNSLLRILIGSLCVSNASSLLLGRFTRGEKSTISWYRYLISYEVVSCFTCEVRSRVKTFLSFSLVYQRRLGEEDERVTGGTLEASQ